MKKGMIAGLLVIFMSFMAATTASAQDSRQRFQNDRNNGSINVNRGNTGLNATWDQNGYHKEGTYYGYKRHTTSHRKTRTYNSRRHEGYNRGAKDGMRDNRENDYNHSR